MRVAWAVVLLVAGVAARGEAPVEEPSPFHSLQDVGKRLEEGFASVLSGETPGKAFAPWIPEDDESRELRRLRLAGADTARNACFQMDLLYFDGDRPLFELRTWVHADADGATFLRLDDQDVSEYSPAAYPVGRARPLLDGVTPFSPFCDAARALLKVLQGDGELPMTAADRIPVLLGPPEAQLRVLGGPPGADGIGRVRQAMARLPEGGEWRVVLDDQYFLVFDTKGRPIRLQKGEFLVAVNGDVTFDLERFDSFDAGR